jgi:hypothetical protein
MHFCLKAVSVLMAVAVALPVVVGQPPGSGVSGQPTPGGPAAAQPGKPQLTVKVFRLERGDPEAVISSLNSLLEAPDAEVAPQVLGGPPGVGAPAQGGPPRGGVGAPLPGGLPGGFGGVPSPAGGMGGFGGLPPGGGIGCFLGTGGANPIPVWRATVQARTRSVVVRGSERHLGVAADVVAILDRPADAPLPKLRVVKAFALKHASAEEMSEVIEALSFDDVKVATPDERLLAVIAPDDAAGTIAQLVKELDVPDKGDPDPKPKREPGKKPKPDDRKPLW